VRRLSPQIDDLFLIVALLHSIPQEELKKILKDTPGLTKSNAKRIIDLIERMNKVSRLPYLPPNKGNHTIQNQMNMIIQLAEEPEVMLLVFADKLQTIVTASESEREYVYREITQIYAPLAERLGLDYLAGRFRNEAFRLTKPEEYNKIKAEVEKTMGMSYEQAAKYLQKVKKEVINRLNKSNINAEVSVRVKSVYSIYEKINSQSTDGTNIEDVDDLLGVRIVFENKEDLWSTVDIPLSFGDPIPGQSELKRIEQVHFEAFHRGIRDYAGRPYEFQYLTRDNYARYKYGVAAHWSYKLHRETSQRFDTDEVNITGDFINDFKALKESLNKWVFIFRQMEETGRIAVKPIRLIAGSIPADFTSLRDINGLNKDYKGAAIYTKEYDINESKIIVSPKRVRSDTYQLQPGEIVDILTSPRFLLRSIKARNTVRNNAKNLRTHVLLNNLDSEEMKKSQESGRCMLIKAGFRIHDYMLQNFFGPVAIELGLRDAGELFAALASTDKISLEQIKEIARTKGRQLLEVKGLNLDDEIVLRKLELILKEFSQESLDELFVSLGTLEVKTEDVYRSLSAKTIPMVIKPEVVGKSGAGIYYMECTCLDRIGLILQITEVLKNLNIDIVHGEVKQLGDSRVKIIFRIKIESYEQVGNALETLGQHVEMIGVASSQLESLRQSGRKFSIKVIAEDRTGVTYEITKAIADLGINIFEFSSVSREGNEANYEFILQVPAMINPAHIKQALEDIEDVAAEVELLSNAIGKGSSLACLNTLYSHNNFSNNPVSVKELIRERAYSATTIRVELANLIAVGLVEVNKQIKPYRYYLTDTLKRAPPEAINEIT
ncbi:MAG: HD domain-containing protein, partial [Candidatus Omnitrophica bacterium]|nr:HD domain-containing protein [Candidatus Omnitrophota bacterium]